MPAYAVATREGFLATAGAAAEDERKPIGARAAIEADGRDGRRRRAAETEPETVANGDVEFDGDAEDLERDNAQEAATVPGGTRSSEPEARQRAVDAVRAERAERKKRARQRGRRKHGRKR